MSTARTTARNVAELVRLPAALTVPGDVWAGAAWAGAGAGAGPAMPVGSVLLYWSGMALNDWADREVDAVERPERVIPSGRMSAGTALAVAGGLGAAGVAVTAAAGGRSALKVSVPLALLVAAYDVVAKDSVAGPVVMASTRGLDVLLGAAAAPGAAALPAVATATHTVGVTLLSRGEVHGARPAAAWAAVAATATATGLVVASALRGDGSEVPTAHRVAAVGFAAAYAAKVGGAQARAAQQPDAGEVRKATGAGIGGLTLLQAAWLAARGRLGTAAVVAGAGPLLKRAAGKVSPT
ncbi:SCO3242 family prenyltransferase [Nocardioides litoris]|uniref:SCO3242 family prenyltransferase n=1 Tax=Nocardioides litoris TaxID=1926648 RepID=UPI00111FF6D4|nr:UbiA family prenyltransferase [Nocardioides litoris]